LQHFWLEETGNLFIDIIQLGRRCVRPQ
jgi:hypothetical protein